MRAARGPTLLFRATVGLGAFLLVVAARYASETPPRALALAAAAVVVTELVQVSGDERSLDPLDAQPFSFASPVHLAAIVVLGVWPATLLAGLGVLLVDIFRDAPRRAVAFNAGAFALATAAGGGAFALAGGKPGTLDLPHDLAAFGVLALAYILVNLTLVNGIVALTSGGSTRAELGEVLRTDSSSRGAEASLGLLFALLVLREPWALVACVPLVLVVYRAYERLAMLRRETARALETFANVVDERDPSTYRHSARVAQYVEELARALGLPSSRVARLRWAGRLHDLGKIAVDTHVLNKPAALDAAEQKVVRRHARLSARLLRRFRFAAGEARAVEYHHERFDGRGYYGISGGLVPLSAHMLVVADSFDAMMSDRPYRRALGLDNALAELERGAGAQFHPELARAFVALRRGGDPRLEVSDDELRKLRRTERSDKLLIAFLRGGLAPGALAAVVGLAAALALAGVGFAVGAGAAAFVALAGVVWARAEQRRAARLARDIRAVTVAAGGLEGAVAGIAGTVAAAGAEWLGLVRWRGDELAARVEREWRLHGDAAPSEAALTSWLLRDAEEHGPVAVDGAELGREGWLVALPVGAGSEAASSFIVVAFDGPRRRWVELGLREAQSHISAALTEIQPALQPALVAVS